MIFYLISFYFYAWPKHSALDFTIYINELSQRTLDYEAFTDGIEYAALGIIARFSESTTECTW